MVYEKEYEVSDSYRETDTEGKEKYVVLQLVNAEDENLLNSANVVIREVKATIRKN